MRYNSVGSDWDNDELSDSSNDERAELRNRNNGIRSRFFRNNSYNRLHSDDSGDDLDDYVPLSPSRNRSGGNSWLSRKKVAVSSAQSLCCAKCCFVFSFSAIVFLAIVAYLLGSNSLYFKVGGKYKDDKPKLLEGVIGAIVMYIVSLLISAYFWYKSRSSIQPTEYSRFND